jgi:hypothetical protein
MAETLLLNPDQLKPLPKDRLNGECFACHQPKAKWAFGEKEEPICSHCFLYKSHWGHRLAMKIAEFVVEVEKEIGRKFLRDAEGNLIAEEDCTRIVGSIAVMSRLVMKNMFRVRDEEPS